MNAPPGAEGHNHSVIALEGDRIIAIMGTTPAPFVPQRATYKRAALTSWVVTSEARGKGIGKGILDYFQQRYQVLTAASISAAGLPPFLGAGFTFLAHIPRFFYVADFDKAQTFATMTDRAQRLTARRQTAPEAQRWQAKPVPAAELAIAAAALGVRPFQP